MGNRSLLPETRAKYTATIQNSVRVIPDMEIELL